MEAKKCTKCNVEKPVEGFSKDKRAKDGLRSDCKACSKAYKEAYYEANPEKKNAWREANLDKSKDACKAYYEANLEKVKARKKVHREANLEKEKARCKAWAEANPDKVNAIAAKRRATKRNQTPELTLEERQRIVLLYAAAKDLEERTGYKWHVDHVIPLAKGGLHHPDNMTLLPAKVNLAKQDKVMSMDELIGACREFSETVSTDETMH